MLIWAPDSSPIQAIIISNSVIFNSLRLDCKYKVGYLLILNHLQMAQVIQTQKQLHFLISLLQRSSSMKSNIWWILIQTSLDNQFKMHQQELIRRLNYQSIRARVQGWLWSAILATTSLQIWLKNRYLIQIKATTLLSNRTAPRTIGPQL